MADANDIAFKACTRCGANKPVTQEHWGANPGGRFGLQSRCRACAAEIQRERAKDPAVRLRIKERKRAAYQANPEKFRAQKRDWAARNPEKIAAQKRREYAKSAEDQKRKALEWQRDNPERARGRKRAYKRSAKGRANAARPENRLRSNCSIAIRRFLQGKKSGKPWASLVDYTMPELMTHLERQFVKGMSWENYGEWHVDHIVPLASFEFGGADSDAFKRAFALANLRPLWGCDNQRKSATVETLL